MQYNLVYCGVHAVWPRVITIKLLLATAEFVVESYKTYYLAISYLFIDKVLDIKMLCVNDCKTDYKLKWDTCIILEMAKFIYYTGTSFSISLFN